MVEADGESVNNPHTKNMFLTCIVCSVEQLVKVKSVET